MLRFRALPSLVALTCLASVPATAADMAPQLRNAQYVLLAYDLGDRLLSSSDAIGRAGLVTDADRAALERVWDLVEDWDRFVVVQRESEADVVFAVRAGRRGSADGGLGGSSPGSGWQARLELGSSDDMLSVYEVGRPGLPLWRAHAPAGLSNDVPLLQSFREALEAAFD
jgi:hypothetical protein